MIRYSNCLLRGSGMPIQVDGVLLHAMSGTELSRVRSEFRLRLLEPINKSPLESSGAGVVMQSNGSRPKNMSGNTTSMIGLCQEGKSSPDALGRSAGVNSFGFFAAHLGLSPCGSFVEEEPDFHLLAQL